MPSDLRALALIATSLTPAAALARPTPPPSAGDNAAALLARHRLAPGDAAATGRALLAMGDVPGALAAFQQAVVADPQSVVARNGLAACYERLGRDDLARQAYEQALIAAPDAALVKVNLGGLLVRIGAADAAVPLLQQAAASAEADVASAARRLLVHAGEALRARAIAAQRAAVTAPALSAPTEVQLAEGVSLVAPAPARIVAAAAGEVRLVAAGPAPELVARLGEDAVLAEPPRPWRAEEEAGVRLAAAAPGERLPTARAISPGAMAPAPAAAISRPPSGPVAVAATAIVGRAPVVRFRRPDLGMAPAATRLVAARQVRRALDLYGRPMAPPLGATAMPATRWSVAPVASASTLPQHRPLLVRDLAAVARAWQRFGGDGPRPSATGGLPGLGMLLRQILI